MGLLDWLTGRPAPLRRRRKAAGGERVVLVSPRGRRISFPPGANLDYHLRRGWKRA